MGDNEPYFQSVRLQVQEIAQWARESSVSCRKDPQWAAGQSLQQPMLREISMAWSSTLVCGAQLSQQWSGTCLSCTLKVVSSTLLGLFDKCLGTPDAKWEIFPGTYGWYMAVLLGSPDGKCGISPGACL